MRRLLVAVVCVAAMAVAAFGSGTASAHRVPACSTGGVAALVNPHCQQGHPSGHPGGGPPSNRGGGNRQQQSQQQQQEQNQSQSQRQCIIVIGLLQPANC
jgi:hypothetical protein